MNTMHEIELNAKSLGAGSVKPIHIIERVSDDDCSWRQTLVFSRKVIEAQCGVKAPKIPTRRDEKWDGMSFPDWDAMSEEDQARVRAVSTAAIEASGYQAFSRGPGQAFQHPASARVYTRFIVVTARGGLDV